MVASWAVAQSQAPLAVDAPTLTYQYEHFKSSDQCCSQASGKSWRRRGLKVGVVCCATVGAGSIGAGSSTIRQRGLTQIILKIENAKNKNANIQMIGGCVTACHGTPSGRFVAAPKLTASLSAGILARVNFRPQTFVTKHMPRLVA